MTKETMLQIAQLTGAVQTIEKLIVALNQQAAALNTKIEELKGEPD